jgi:hypothetical protein
MTKLLRASLIAIIAFTPAAALAEPSLRGRIDFREQAHPIQWLFIYARNTETGQVYESKSDAQGLFTFENLEAGPYILTAEREGIERVIKTARVEQGSTTEVALLAIPSRMTGNTAVDKHIASSNAQGGSYPAGNISYLNINDALDLYLMWVYFVILGLLSAYGVYRYRLVYLFLRYRNHSPKPKARFEEDRLPRVTVQLPLFNEMYVAERLIESVTGLDYPRHLLEIQVLDDSTDDTTRRASAVVKKYADQGFNISYHHRENRAGFKAGALEAGLKKAAGEFILIFDADFTPRA